MVIIKLTGFLHKVAFDSFCSAYMLRSNNHLVATHFRWSSCIYKIIDQIMFFCFNYTFRFMCNALLSLLFIKYEQG